MTDIPRKVIVPKNITDALRNVIFPGSEQDIVSLDMVQEIRVAGKKITFSLVFQRSNDPNMVAIIEACEEAILAELGSDVDIRNNITAKAIHQMERPILPGVKNLMKRLGGNVAFNFNVRSELCQNSFFTCSYHCFHIRVIRSLENH